jgi:hypothetical protein
MANQTVSIKGSAFFSVQSWVERTHGASSEHAVVAQLSSGHRVELDRMIISGWYPAELMDGIWEAIRVVLYPTDAAAFQRALRALGRSVAEDHLNSVSRAFLRFCVTPRAVLEFQSRIWGLYFRGIDIEVVPDADRRGGEVRVKNLGQLRYIGPAACGWLAFLFEHSGAKAVRSTSALLSEGSPRPIRSFMSFAGDLSLARTSP